MAEPISLYLFISYLSLFAIVLFLFLIKLKKKVKIVSPLEILSLLFVVLGLLYNLTTAFGFALISAGVVFFSADLYLRMRKISELPKNPPKKSKRKRK